VGYVMMRGTWKVPLVQISAKTGVLLSTCSKIIREDKSRAAEPVGNPDLSAIENLVPQTNNEKGLRYLLSENEKQYLVAVTLSDSEHCGMTFESLGQASSYIVFNQYVHKLIN